MPVADGAVGGRGRQPPKMLAPWRRKVVRHDLRTAVSAAHSGSVRPERVLKLEASALEAALYLCRHGQSLPVKVRTLKQHCSRVDT